VIYITVTIIKGSLIGECPACWEPLLGEFDSDDLTPIKMTCINCGNKYDYERTWVELPEMDIRIVK
jgi:uncharacterized protein (DUF983 family)